MGGGGGGAEAEPRGIGSRGRAPARPPRALPAPELRRGHQGVSLGPERDRGRRGGGRRGPGRSWARRWPRLSRGWCAAAPVPGAAAAARAHRAERRGRWLPRPWRALGVLGGRWFPDPGGRGSAGGVPPGLHAAAPGRWGGEGCGCQKRAFAGKRNRRRS